MLNDEDITKLKSVFGTKEDILGIKTDILEMKGGISNIKTDLNVFRKDFSDSKKETDNNFLRLDGEIGSIKTDILEMKSDMADLKELVQGLIVSTDSIAKAIGNLSVEYAAISTQLSRHELWIKQIAEKVGLKLATD